MMLQVLNIKNSNRFFSFILPVMIFSPKTFPALSRICSNLSGFRGIVITETSHRFFSKDFNSMINIIYFWCIFLFIYFENGIKFLKIFFR